MARKLRIEYPGAIYHVMNRGDRKERIFLDEQDRTRFLETLADCGAKTEWEFHAFVLMPNHFHLVVETPRANLVVGMKWLLGTYTARFNRRHRMSGHLFGGRYKAVLVDGSGTGYLKTVCDYVHLNPARARLIEPEDPLRSFAWSSWPIYLQPPAKRPPWLRVDRLLGEYGIPKDSAAGRRHLEQALEERRRSETAEEFNAVRQGWCLGDDEFRKELLTHMSDRIGAEHYGRERTETELEKAERIVATELKRRGWTEDDLQNRPKGDPAKVRIALRLRADTVQSVEWVANRLQLGSRSYANHLLWRARKNDQG